MTDTEHGYFDISDHEQMDDLWTSNCQNANGVLESSNEAGSRKL